MVRIYEDSIEAQLMLLQARNQHIYHWLSSTLALRAEKKPSSNMLRYLNKIYECK